MEFLPLFYQIKTKSCLLVGGGKVALRKAELLAKAGAVLHVRSREIIPALHTLVNDTGGTYLSGDYSSDDLTNKHLIIAATDDIQLNQRVSADAQAQHIPVNVVDQPELCTFIFPAIIDRSPIVVAVSSGGTSPVLARLIRSKIEIMIPAAYGQLAKLANQFRDQVKAKFASIEKRRYFWEDALTGPAAEMMLAGKAKQAQTLMQQRLDDENENYQGEVYLIGAGPGDPDLLTFKALRLMQKADVVLYDRLVAPQILDMVRRDAEKIHVGKRRSAHTLPQHDINELLVSYALQGKRVARLKGGDPFIFGRGGEEIEKLAEHMIPFQVVPGITAASGCAAYAGIPLTHRDYAQSVRFVTGHLKEGSCDLPWQTLAQGEQTLVFYMGLLGLPDICHHLVQHGLSADTPVALVQQGTTSQQRVFEGTLSSIENIISNQEVKAPTLIIVGNVVKLRDKLAWF